MVYLKQTFLIPAGPPEDPFRNHLFVTLTNLCSNNQHLLVPICSIVDGKFHDPACELLSSDYPHSFITRNSYVEYRRIVAHHHLHIEKCLNSGYFIPREDMSDELFNRIINGVLVSRFTPRWAKQYLDRWPNT